MASKKETVHTEDEQGNELVLDVRHPSGKIVQDAQLMYSLHWQELVDKGVKVKRQIDDMLEERGIWTDKQDKEREKLTKRIVNLGKELSDKKVKKTRARGKELAVEIYRTRLKLRDLLRERSELDANSAESLSENVRFDYLVSVCTVYNNTGEPFFKDYEDYIARRDEKAAWAAASKLAAMLYGGVDFSENFEENLIEIQFLKKFGFMKDKKLVNDKGEEIDLDGNVIPPSTEGTDIYGNKIVDGKTQFEFGGFEDDLPQPEPESVVEEDQVEENKD